MLQFKLLGQLEHGWPYVYFDGMAEDLANAHQGGEWVAPDLVSCDQKLVEKAGEVNNGMFMESVRRYLFEPREYACLVYDEPAILFLLDRSSKVVVPPHYEGLIVLESDREKVASVRKAMQEGKLEL